MGRVFQTKGRIQEEKEKTKWEVIGGVQSG